MFLKKRFFPPILTSSLLFSAQLFGQTAQIKFEHLSVADGLSQSTVNVILQDNRGFMWFGTLNGLNRYDGYEFIKYRHDPNDPHSISSDQVFSLCEDREGNLWVGTNYGLNRFDWKSESFISYQPVHDDMNSLSGFMISAIYENKSGVLWIGTNYGLNRYNPEKDNFTPYFKDPNSPAGLSDNTVVALYEDQDRYLWIGTRNGGLNRFDPERKKVTHLFRHGRQASLQYTHSVYEKIDSLLNARRPLASVLQIENAENAATPFEITSEVRALVVSVGEGTQEMSDYGWLEKNGEPVWQMSFERTRHAGGAAKNRIQISTVTLLPGSYQLKYRSDDSHSYGHWNQLAPSDPDWWGIQFIPLFDDEAEFFEQNLKNYFRPSQLSSNAITVIKQDSEGVFWIGTRGGLNKLEFGNAEGLIATPEIGNSDSGLYQMVPRVTIYRKS